MDIFIDNNNEPGEMKNSDINDNNILNFAEAHNNKTIKNKAISNNKIGINNRLTKDEKDNLIRDLIKRVFEQQYNESNQLNDIEKQYEEGTYVIDRFEGDYAVCENRENREMFNIKKANLPNDISEGDVLTYKENTFSINNELREEIEQRISEKVKNIFEED